VLETIRNRWIVIALLVATSIYALVPRTVEVRERDERGVMTTDTVTRVPLKRGLDLQGGMHLALELDQSQQVSADPKKDIELALTVLRKRIDEFGVTEPLIQRVGDERIVVELAGISDPKRATSIVQRSAFLEFRFTDKTQAFDRALPSMDRALRQLGIKGGTGAAAQSAVQSLLGGESAKAGADSAAADTAGSVLASLIRPGGMPGEYVVMETAFPRVDSLINLPEVQRALPRDVELRWAALAESQGLQSVRYLYALEQKPIVTGANLVNAGAQLDPLTNGPIVTFELDRAGGRRFGEQTGRHVGDYMAIVLDGRVQGRPPVIQSRIDRNGQITLSGRTLQEAQDLALTLRAGALPIPLKIVERRQVSASLGEDSIKGGIRAGLVGTALVVLIMVGYYAASGALAVAALGFYALFSLGGLALLEATLTLPGIAGLILSVGIAVDANVLIFERIREELDLGKTPSLAVSEGFRHALPAITDSSISTILTALFLFQFGTGPVKGFAVTLIMGIAASLITAIFVTRTFYLMWLQRGPATLSIGSARLFRGAAYDFIGMRRLAIGATGAALALGLVLTLARGGLDYSIEFTGGTLVQVAVTEDGADIGRMRSGLEAEGVRGAEIVQFAGTNEFVIRARTAAGGVGDADNTQLTAQAVARGLDASIGAGKYRIDRTEAVSPKVGGELRTQAFLAIFLSFFAVLAYLAVRFEWRFGVAAVIATAHDIVLTILFIGALKLEVSLVVVAGVLTMVGYSLNDTIIIFDRVRENLKKLPKAGFDEILNRSINETLPRSVLTHGTTLATLLALTIFGGEVIRPFALVMFFGVFTGTFSSIYIAAPVLKWIEAKYPGANARRAAAVPAGAGARPRPQTV
jgi:protein-export membrane protein SecD/preprotein translocase SecF subunit